MPDDFDNGHMMAYAGSTGSDFPSDNTSYKLNQVA